jgi:hypothetical protein
MGVVSQSLYTLPCDGPKLRHFDDDLYGVSHALFDVCGQLRFEI